MTEEELSDLIKWSAEKVRQERERERLTDLIASYFGVDPAYYGIEVSHFADYLIENGVVIPVRCKNCKHYVWDEFDGCHVCLQLSKYVKKDFFCSYG